MDPLTNKNRPVNIHKWSLPLVPFDNVSVGSTKGESRDLLGCLNGSLPNFFS